MTSFHVICGFGFPQSKILGTPMHWRLPEKLFLKTFFFGENLQMCPWSLSLASSIAVLALKGSVFGKAVLGLGFFLYPWHWPRALCPRLHLYQLPIKSKEIVQTETALTV